MAFAFKMLTSIHGRRLGLSSTNGIIQAVTSTGGRSTDFVMAAQMWGPGMVAVSSTASTLLNSGVSVLNSTSGAAYTIGYPIPGVLKEVYVVSSASALTFGGTSTSEVFYKPGGASAGSTIVTLANVTLAGYSFALRGKSTSEWMLIAGSTVSIS